MTAARRFSGPVLDELAQAKILGVRAGTEHRYTGVWVVVVKGRVFVRSWNDKPTGWYRAFQAEPQGSIQLAGREIAIRGRRLQDKQRRDAPARSAAQRSMSQADLVRATGSARASVSDLVSGKRPFTVDPLRAVATVFGLHATAFLGTDHSEVRTPSP